MKTIIKIFWFCLAIAIWSQCEQDNPNPLVTIPDVNFLNALIELGIDTDGDGQISNAEAEAISDLNVNGTYDTPGKIQDMKGIEAFINLYTLHCSYNQLTALDVSNNTALREVFCEMNQLASIDVSNNTALTRLRCDRNQLTTLNVTNNTAIKSLSCASNQLTTLNVSNNTALLELFCFGNKITSLDVTQNNSLKYLYCYVNPITKLELSNMNSLTVLECHDCELTTLDILNCSNLSTLFAGNTSPLRPYKNKLTSLDCSGCGSLKTLFCPDTQILNLNISDCFLLEILDCGGNKLETLNISKNTMLISLEIILMPTLYEVCVWELPFPPTGVDVDTTGSPNIYYTMDCAGDK